MTDSTGISLADLLELPTLMIVHRTCLQAGRHREFEGQVCEVIVKIQDLYGPIHLPKFHAVITRPSGDFLLLSLRDGPWFVPTSTLASSARGVGLILRSNNSELCFGMYPCPPEGKVEQLHDPLLCVKCFQLPAMVADVIPTHFRERRPAGWRPRICGPCLVRSLDALMNDPLVKE